MKEISLAKESYLQKFFQFKIYSCPERFISELILDKYCNDKFNVDEEKISDLL